MTNETDAERRLQVINELENPENWRPNFTRISKKLKIPVSTIWDIYKKESKVCK